MEPSMPAPAIVLCPDAFRSVKLGQDAAHDLERMRRLRQRIAADESLHFDADALALLRPTPACGIFNIKLMTCGGSAPPCASPRWRRTAA
jgi:hypothetical protein